MNVCARARASVCASVCMWYICVSIRSSVGCK